MDKSGLLSPDLGIFAYKKIQHPFWPLDQDMGQDWFTRHQNAFTLSIGLLQLFLTPEEFSHAIENRQTLVWEAITDGILLYDPGFGLEQIQRF